MPWQRNRSMERVTSEKEKTGGPEAKIPRPGLVFIKVLPKSRTKSFDPLRQHSGGVLTCGDVLVKFVSNTVWMWLALALCAALTTWVRAGFMRTRVVADGQQVEIPVL